MNSDNAWELYRQTRAVRDTIKNQVANDASLAAVQPAQDLVTHMENARQSALDFFNLTLKTEV